MQTHVLKSQEGLRGPLLRAAACVSPKEMAKGPGCSPACTPSSECPPQPRPRAQLAGPMQVSLRLTWETSHPLLAPVPIPHSAPHSPL